MGRLARLEGERVTIANFHTAHELSDLLAAKDSNLSDLVGGVAGVHGVDLTESAWAAWMADFYAFQAKWGALHVDADPLIASAKASVLGWDQTTAETLWTVALELLPPFDDLVRRWPALPGNPLPVYPTRPTPQPTAPDFDLNLLNALPNVATPAKSYALVAAIAVVGTLAALFALKRV